jgi:hypothetical protein
MVIDKELTILCPPLMLTILFQKGQCSTKIGPEKCQMEVVEKAEGVKTVLWENSNCFTPVSGIKGFCHLVPMSEKIKVLPAYVLKGTVSQDFLLQLFFMNHLPPSPRNNIRVISNFIENLRRYLQVPPVSRATGVNDTCRKFAASVIDTGGAPSLAKISTNFRKKSK